MVFYTRKELDKEIEQIKQQKQVFELTKESYYHEPVSTRINKVYVVEDKITGEQILESETDKELNLNGF